jgi:CHAT domain-containing protein
VHRLCQEKQPAWEDDSQVFGVPDALAPHITREVEAVAALLPRAHLYLGADATTERLRRRAARSRFVHLATHGVARSDNPLFSSIRMGDSRLCLFDLEGFEFAAELITLSGCATGVHETVGAGELIGLGRGLLHAGAHAVHLSLWEVNDGSTAEYMQSFYTLLQAGASIAEALRSAMLATRVRYPHPYYWAAFAITGRTQFFDRPSISGALRRP